MENNYTNRKVDRIEVDKSQKYLWKYIQEKKHLGLSQQTAKAKKAHNSSWFTPKKFAWLGTIAALTIIAVLVVPNLQNLLKGDITGQSMIANAHFTMTADSQDSAGIDSKSSFTLTSDVDLDAALIEANLESLPTIDLNVTKIEAGKYKVEPAQNLESNTIYNFTITSVNEGKTEEFSWAYQVKDEFKIYGSMPGDKTTSVPINSGIEIAFSHENYDTEQVKNYFEISPATEGSFEKHNRVLVFVPTKGLNPSTIYTVTVKAGLPLKDSDKKLAEDFSFSFETSNVSSTGGTNFYFNQDYYEIGTNMPVAMGAAWYGMTDEATDNTVNVKIHKFKSEEDYIKVVKERNEIPSWARYAKENYAYNRDQMNYMGEFDGTIEEIEYSKFIYVPTAQLEPGFYLFTAQNNDKVSTTLVQITDLSSYINLTKDGNLVWVNDVSTGQPVNNATVELLDENKSIKTNADGIATFNMDFSDTGSIIIKVTSPDGKVQISNLYINEYQKEAANLADYWYTFTTDRPVYQPSDTIEFWGFLKPKSGDTQVGEIKAELYQGGYFWNLGTYSEEVIAEKGNNNTFHGNLETQDLPPGYYTLSIYNDDELISQEYIEIVSYAKPSYQIDVTTDKRAIFYDEKIKVDIISRFFDGTPVPFLKLYYNVADQLTTDANGKYSFEYTPKSDFYCSDDGQSCENFRNEYLTFDPVPKEDSMISGKANVRVFKSRIAIKAKTKTENNIANVKITTNKVDLTPLNEDENAGYNDYLGEAAPNRDIKGKLIEFWWDKIETGEHYDFINKITVKEYRYETRENIVGEISLSSDANGEAEYNFEMQPNKHYRVVLNAADDQGKLSHTTAYAYGKTTNNDEYKRIKILNSEEEYGPYKFELGKAVETAIVAQDSVITPKENEKYLFMQLNNGLTEYAVKASPTYNFTFKQAQVPGVRVEGIIFTGKYYETVWGDTVMYDPKEKTINVEVKANKDTFEPGEKATLTVKTTDLNGKPVSAEVLLDLVDEAYYELFWDSLENPLDELYRFINDGVYSTYSTHENPMVKTEGGLGGCFKEGTKILMDDMGYKNIEDIEVGDFITTKESALSDRFVKAKVLKLQKHTVSAYLVINEDLEVTPEHVVFVNGHFDLAGKVKVGDTMLDKDGNSIEVWGVRKVYEPTKVYNFEVEHYHTYFANNYYVHNDKGGARSEFKDTALFKSVTTNGSGDAQITFELPDNITSWRVTALAIDSDQIRAGRGGGNIIVTKPFFADLVMNKEYSIKDEPNIGLRAYGKEITKDDNVTFTVGDDVINGKAYTAVDYKLPKLELGEHELRLDAKSGNYEDALIEKYEVVGSRLKQTNVEILPTVTEETDFPMPSEGYAKVYFLNAGLAGHYGQLLSLYYTNGERLDQKLSEQIGKDLINEYFDLGFVDRTVFDPADYQNFDGGLKLLQYADPDLKLTALATAVDPKDNRFSKASLKSYFYQKYMDKDANLEEVVLSLLGLASIDEPVLQSLQIIKDEPKLSLEDKIYIGLAFAELGSKNDASQIYNEVKGSFMNDNPDQTALGTVLAAAVGEKDDAFKYWEYVGRKQLKDDIPNIYLMGYLKYSLKTADPDSVKFTARIGDTEKEVELDKCETFNTLASSFKGLSVANVDGDLAAVVVYDEAIEPSEFKRSDIINISRSYKVNGVETTDFTEGDLVEVNLAINYSGEGDAYFQITDVLPSGLKILSSSGAPFGTNGQEVFYGWSTKTPRNISYYATVVNSGKFYADPARISKYDDWEIANISEPVFITISSYNEAP